MFSFTSSPLSALFYLFFSSLSVLLLFYSLLAEMNLLMSFNFFKLGSLDMKVELTLMKMDLMFSLCVLLISISVMLFTSSYMAGDKNVNYFIIMVCMFIFSMNMLIYVPHMVMLLLGWDGLGLTSYLLVVYYMNDQSLSSGMITALSNRVGDSLIIMALSLCYYNMIFSYYSLLSGAGLVMFFFMLASFTKSAQMPFSAWLPAAMAAPTPVSALVHSSTLVTAGIFLLYRFYSSLSVFVFFHPVTFYLGVVTCLMASLSAMFENDLKKIIALSTLSQLGVMMFTLGLGMPSLTFFHLITHAMFKALMFICAGTIIHSQINSQDIRFMGNIWYSMPMTCSALLSSNMALCGFPFMSGFYSKDMIMEVFMTQSHPLSSAFLCVLSVLLTGLYTSRLCYFLLWKPSSNSALSILNDESTVTYISYSILLSGALFSGFWMMGLMISSVADVSILPLFMKLLVLSMILFFFSGMQILAVKFIKMNYFYFLIMMWNLGLISSNFSYFYLKVSSLTSMMEKTWVELVACRAGEEFTEMSKNFQNWSSINLYRLVTSIFIIIIITLFYY